MPSSGVEARLHLLDVKRALSIFVDRVLSFRKVESLFVPFGVANRGSDLAMSALSGWVGPAIVQAYSLGSCSLPQSIRGRATRAMSTSVAALQGASLLGICRAATWSDSSPFAGHCRIWDNDLCLLIF